jgi:plasmid stabilization system protein ParE
MKVTLSGSAVEDLASLLAYYAAEGLPDVGRRLVSEVLSRIEELQANPDIGRVVPEFGTPALRELIHPPFRIVYRRQQQRAQVVRVWRSERVLRLQPDGE